MSTLKCVIGYNYYSQRHHIMNNKMTSERDPRCDQDED